MLGWSAYLQELSSWAAQGSVKFSREIEQSSRWLETIRWSKLSAEQQNRSVRLCALLRTTFIDHGRISLMIEGYQESLDVEVSPDLLVRVLVELVANYWSWPGGGYNPATPELVSN